MSKYRPYLQYFDNYQEVYLRQPGFFDPFVNLVTHHLATNPNMRILDVGCGHGDFLSALHQIIGSDASYYGLTLAHHEVDHITKHHPFISPILGNQQNLLELFKNQTFDIVINFNTLSYLRQNDQLSVVNQMLSVLKQRGILLLSLIDHWTRFSPNIIQAGEGYVQFAYNPLIYSTVEKQSIKLYSEKINPDGYRICLYRKTNGRHIPFRGLVRVASFFLMHNIFHRHLFKKSVHKVAMILLGGR